MHPKKLPCHGKLLPLNFLPNHFRLLYLPRLPVASVLVLLEMYSPLVSFQAHPIIHQLAPLRRQYPQSAILEQVYTCIGSQCMRRHPWHLSIRCHLQDSLLGLHSLLAVTTPHLQRVRLRYQAGDQIFAPLYLHSVQQQTGLDRSRLPNAMSSLHKCRDNSNSIS
jgi:hypothetical protein